MARDPKPTLARIRKVLALLDSDQAGEVRAAGRALNRLLGTDPAALDEVAGAPRPERRPERGPERALERRELEACLAYAAEAITELTREIETLRRDNSALRERAPVAASIGWPGTGRPPQRTAMPGARAAH